MDQKPRYLRCRYYIPDIFSSYENGKEEKCRDFCAPHAKTLGEQEEQKKPIDVGDCETCTLFKSRYIEYPLTISGIRVEQPKAWNVSCTPIRVRPCAEDRTYFGILLGDFPQRTQVSFSEETAELNVETVNNPCILIPELNRVVFGCESWWSRLQPGEDVSDIMDDTIENTWYVKLFRNLENKKNGGDPPV